MISIKIQKFSLLVLIVAIVAGVFILSPQAHAVTCPDGSTVPDAQFERCPTTETPPEDAPQYVANDCNDEDINAENCGIIRYVVLAINILSALAGIVIAAAIIMGGIQYTMSGGDPQKVVAAKTRIRNAIIALLVFLFGYALLNYLVPGGVL